jgi:hypothetical protein
MMQRTEVPKELFVIEDSAGIPLRNHQTGTMFYSKKGHAQRKVPANGKVVTYELARKADPEPEVAE